MGKLTKSLKEATKKLDQVQYGINQMQELGQEITENTFRVAETALRTGYLYAKAEAEETPTQQLLPGESHPSEKNQLKGETHWTEASLKAKFGSYDAAYRYLRDVRGIKLRSRSWKNLVDAFNEGVEQLSLAQRVVQLEQTVNQQTQYIATLEEKIHQMQQQLLKLTTAVERLTKQG
ncbi:hypothetical protein [Microseira sp. BLCC-F43]|jgi:TolA-binding protein|uniref:hypothetical protein n=1 Tax=Microseira sp. BLCC-F43 TaxID=3153602 RepID=UPI0035B939A5